VAVHPLPPHQHHRHPASSASKARQLRARAPPSPNTAAGAPPRPPHRPTPSPHFPSALVPQQPPPPLLQHPTGLPPALLNPPPQPHDPRPLVSNPPSPPSVAPVARPRLLHRQISFPLSPPRRNRLVLCSRPAGRTRGVSEEMRAVRLWRRTLGVVVEALVVGRVVLWRVLVRPMELARRGREIRGRNRF